MKRNIIILFLIFPILLFAVPWTVMVYMNGDNNLEEAAINDFAEIANSNIDTSVANILVQMDRRDGYNSDYGDWTDTKRFYVVHGSTPSVANALLPDLGELNMGNPNTLKDFILWGINNYPADHYAVIVWDHGNSWYKKSFSTKDFSFDDTDNDDSIGIANGELRTALGAVYLQLGKNLDIFGIDACISQTLTLSGEVYDYTDYLIASEDYEPWDGWSYSAPLDQLFGDSGETPEDFAGSFCQVYYSDQHYYSNNTLSVISLSNFSNFINEFNILCDMWIELIPSGSRKIIFDEMKKNEFFDYDKNTDLGNSLNKIRSANNFTQDINNQIATVLEQYDILISTSYGYVNTNGEPASGITIYYGNEPSYRQSNLSDICKWDDFLFYSNKDFLYPVYPNPASNDVTVSGILSGDKIYIYSTIGNLLYLNRGTDTLDVNIDISKYCSGIYFLLVNSPKNGIIIRKFAKVR